MWVDLNALYFYDSLNFEDRQGILAKLKNDGAHIFLIFMNLNNNMASKPLLLIVLATHPQNLGCAVSNVCMKPARQARGTVLNY